MVTDRHLPYSDVNGNGNGMVYPTNFLNTLKFLRQAPDSKIAESYLHQEYLDIAMCIFGQEHESGNGTISYTIGPKQEKLTKDRMQAILSSTTTIDSILAFPFDAVDTDKRKDKHEAAHRFNTFIVPGYDKLSYIVPMLVELQYFAGNKGRELTLRDPESIKHQLSLLDESVIDYQSTIRTLETENALQQNKTSPGTILLTENASTTISENSSKMQTLSGLIDNYHAQATNLRALIPDVERIRHIISSAHTYLPKYEKSPEYVRDYKLAQNCLSFLEDPTISFDKYRDTANAIRSAHEPKNETLSVAQKRDSKGSTRITFSPDEDEDGKPIDNPMFT